jgi:hypothetical protein
LPLVEPTNILITQIEPDRIQERIIMRHAVSLTCIGSLVVLTGCFQMDQTFTINPDGSGKVVYDVTMAAPNENAIMGMLGMNPPAQKSRAGKPNTGIAGQAMGKEMAKNILENSKGIETWKEVSIEQTKEGKTHFRGTAYFRDVSQVQISDSQGPGVSRSERITFTKGAAGEMIIEFQQEGKSQTPAARPTVIDPEVEQNLQMTRQMWPSIKPMLAPMFNEIKASYTINVPGKISNVSNFKEERGALRLSIDGAKMMKAMDQMLMDDAFMREQVRSKKNPFETPAMDPALNEKLFGQKGPIRATITGATKPLFDYETEVAEAQKHYPELVKRLALSDPGSMTLGGPGAIPSGTESETSLNATAAFPRGHGFKSVKVVGVRMVGMPDERFDDAPFHGARGYSLALVGELPGAVQSMSSGKVLSALGDTGESLLPKNEFDRMIDAPRLSKDKKMVRFEVNLASPPESIKGLKEISGILSATIGSGGGRIDLGITELKAGAKGTEFGALIRSLNTTPQGDTLSLQVNLPRKSIESITVLDEAGRPFPVSPSGWSQVGESTGVGLIARGRYPSKGKVLIDLARGSEKVEVPFKIENITTLGQPQ